MFITFEGIEGCGKTTQIKRLAERLENESGISLVRTFEPGGTEIGSRIREILLDSRNENLSHTAELMLYAADRAQHIEEVILPALEKGEWVICDRFFDATVSYQGTARGMDMELIHILNDRVMKGVKPDLTLLLDCPVETGLSRALERNKVLSMEGQDRFEREKLDFHEKVRRGYLELAEKYNERFVIIDAALTQDEVEKKIFQAVEPYAD